MGVGDAVERRVRERDASVWNLSGTARFGAEQPCNQL